MKRLENWKLIGNQNGYTAPEDVRYHLVGEVYNSPDRPDGRVITTSALVSVKGKVITTETGSEYELGEPDPVYLEWCVKNHVHIPTKDEPIKVHK